eukprot:5545628-Pleurochrysis_carterae.AAC.1
MDETAKRLRPATTVPHASSCLMLSAVPSPPPSRSRSVSLYTSRNEASSCHSQPSARINFAVSRILESERGISPQLAGSGVPCMVK